MVHEGNSPVDTPDARRAKLPRLNSDIRNDFDMIEEGDTWAAVCRHCKNELRGSSCATQLTNHLVRCPKRPSNDLTPLYNGRETKRDASISSFRFERGRAKYEGFDEMQSRFDLARMIICHGYSLGMVDDSGFRVFAKNLQPLFEPVSFNTVEADCMEIYKKEKKKLGEVLAKFPGKISLSADKWVSPDFSTDYLCLTAHYIDESWQLTRKILNFIRMDPSISEDTRLDHIMACLRDWGIEGKLFSMTFDSSASHENLSLRLGKSLSSNGFLYSNGRFFKVYCAASIVSAMVQEGLTLVASITNKIRKCVRYLQYSQTSETKFKKLVKEAGGSQSKKCLFLNNPRRWESTFFMLEAAVDNMEAFVLLEQEDNSFKSIEWDRAKNTTRFLKFFIELTNKFVRDKSVTENLYFTDLCEVYQKLEELHKDSGSHIHDLGSKMRGRFRLYWDRCRLALAFATILDPRYKMQLIKYQYKRIYGLEAPSQIENVLESLKTLIEEHSISLDERNQDNGFSDSGRERSDSLIGFEKYLNETSQVEETKSPLDKYLDEPLLPRTTEFSALNWWRFNSPRYPILARVAMNVLAIPLSKAVSESVFVAGGESRLDRSFGSLSTDTIQALLCCRDWYLSGLES